LLLLLLLQALPLRRGESAAWAASIDCPNLALGVLISPCSPVAAVVEL
jgi:hypothetical protein